MVQRPKDNSHIVAAEVGLELPGQNLESSTLANTVRPDETEHLTGARSGEPVKFERVCRVPMRDFRLQIGRQVDDSNSLKRTSADVMRS